MITRALGLALVVALTTAAAPKPLDVSGPKPAWVSADDDTYTQAGKVYFRTVVDRQKRLDVAVQRAKFLGVRAIRDSRAGSGSNSRSGCPSR